MRLKRFLTVGLLTFVAASIAALGLKGFRRNPQAAAPPSDGVVVYYLHGTFRCERCLNIEAYAHQAINSGFAEQLRGGRLHWRAVDYDRPENRHFVTEYQPIAPSVVLVEVSGGEQRRWKNLAKVWDLAADKGAFVEYIQQETGAFLEGKSGRYEEQAVGAFLAAMGLALWFGIQTAVCPCPMATNIAAISFIGRRVGSPRQVLLGGLLYSLGRTLTYVALAVLLLSTILANSDVSVFLQKYMTQILGPIVIVVAMFLLQTIRLGSFSGPGVSQEMQKRLESLGIWGALAMGVLFAASFCPGPAIWFFGSLMPLAVKCNSTITLPLLYGVGTALPVVFLAVLIALSAQRVGKAFNMISRFEWWARRITGVVFLVVGIVFSLEYCFGVPVISVIQTAVGGPQP